MTDQDNGRAVTDFRPPRSDVADHQPGHGRVLVAGLVGLRVVVNARTFSVLRWLGQGRRADVRRRANPAGTRQLLDALARAEVPATLCLIGWDMAAHPDLAGDIASTRHELGHHTYSHARMWFVSGRFRD